MKYLAPNNYVFNTTVRRLTWARIAHVQIFGMLVFLMFAVIASGQTKLSGSIKGRVLEISPASTPIADAIVTVTNNETGLTRSVLTNANGEYAIEILPPGFYTLTGRKDGYVAGNDGELSRFPLLIKQNEVQPPPIRLSKINATSPQVAPVPQPPTVNSGAEFAQLANTSNATRSMNFDSAFLQALPLSGSRTFDALALLAPGVAPPPNTIGTGVGPGFGPGVGTSGQFSVNGLRSRANNFTVDGSDNNDEDIGVRRQGFTSLLPQSIESIREFRLTTLLPEPQFGRNLGGQVDAVTRSGSTSFYGTLYGFYTDRRLKARDPFDQTIGSTGAQTFTLRRAGDGRAIELDGRPLSLANPVSGEDPLTRASAGLIIGGPLTKQMNFLFTYERQELNAARESHFAVPTVAERGLFGSGDQGLRVRTADGRFQALPPASATGNLAFSLYPFPNNPIGPYGANTYTQVLPANADGNIASLRFDRPNLSLFGRPQSFTGRYNFTDDRTMLPVTGEAIHSSLRAGVRTQNLSLYLNGSLSNGLENELRFSYGRTRLSFADARNYCASRRPADSCLLRSDSFPETPFLLNAPYIANATVGSIGPGGEFTTGVPRYFDQQFNVEFFLGPIGQVLISGFSPLGVDVNHFPQDRVNNTFQVADTAFQTIGQHRLTGGVDLRRSQLNSRLERNFRPKLVFSGAADISRNFLASPGFTAPNQFYLGSDFAAVGAPTGFFQTQGVASTTPDPTIGLRYWQSGVFFSDQYRVRPNLTLTLGLRYELNSVPNEVDRRIENTFTDPLVTKFIEEERRLSGGSSGFAQYLSGRRTIYQKDANNLAPHVAFALSLDDRNTTVLRGGYGVYYDQILGAVVSQSRSVFPTFVTFNLAGLSPIRRGTELGIYNPNLLAAPNTLNQYQQTPLLGKDIVETLVNLRDFANTIPGRAPTFPGGPGFVLPAFDLVTPYAQHWTLSFERQMLGDLLLSAAYVGTKGAHLLRFATPNYGPNVLPVVTNATLRFGNDVIFTGFSAPPGRNFNRDFPLLGSFTSIESNANSVYHGLQLGVEKRLSRQLRFTGAYAWSHAIDEVSDLFDLGGARAIPQNGSHLRNERGSANFDLRHRFVSSVIWNLTAPGKRLLSDGWQIASIVTMQTGQPYTIYSGFDVNLDGNLTDRLNQTTGIVETKTGVERFRLAVDRSALQSLTAPIGKDGGIGRNTFRARGTVAVDLAINKHIQFSERSRLELRVEIFNLFNRAHYGLPINQLDSPGIGRSVDTRLTPRTLQFGGRFNF